MRLGTTTRVLLAAATAVVAVATVTAPASAAPPTTMRISSSPAGAQGDAVSGTPWVSPNGRYVTFQSSASNLVPADTNFSADVFLRDRTTGLTERVSVNGDGVQGNYPSGGGRGSSVTSDGRYVAFDSFAFNLVPGDTNGQFDVFVRDRQRRTTTRVDVSSDGYQANAAGFDSAITANGRYVTFTSPATNLVAADSNGTNDVFIRDVQTSRTTLVSTRSDGGQANGASSGGVPSADGRYVAFESAASNLVVGDTNNATDVFLKDLQTGAVTRISVTDAGRQFPGGADGASMSADGRLVAFTGQPGSIVAQAYVRDRALSRATLVSASPSGSPGNRGSYEVSISGDGRYIAFNSGSDNLVPGAPNFFNTLVRDLRTNTTTLESRTSTGAAISESTGEPAMSDGALAFVSYADNVVSDAVGRTGQVYLRTL